MILRIQRSRIVKHIAGLSQHKMWNLDKKMEDSKLEKPNDEPKRIKMKRVADEESTSSK